MRHTRMIPVGLALAILCAIILGPVAVYATEPPPDPFPGTWSVSLTPSEQAQQGGAKAFSDALVFEDAALLTESFAFYGLNPGTYSRPEANPNSFSATLDSGSQGSLAVSGSVSGATIQGTLTWTKKDGSVWQFAFTGTKS